MPTKTWNGGENDWDNPGSPPDGPWSPAGVPGPTDHVVINNGGVPTLNSGDAPIDVASIRITRGILYIADPGVTQSVSGDVSVSGLSSVTLDVFSAGGSSMTIGGTLSVSGERGNGVDIGNDNITSADILTVNGTGGLSNAAKSEIGIVGSGKARATLDVANAAAGFGTVGVETGIVVLGNDALLEFKSGQIMTIDGTLELDGAKARVADAGALGRNSALTGLADVAGALTIMGRASVSTTGALTNSGHVSLEGAGSTLSIGGALTNNGAISIANDTEELTEAVGGAGSFSLSTANFQFDSGVSAGQTINETGADALTLEQAQSFAATISGFGTGDTIDAANFLFSGTRFHFHENATGAGGTLTLTDTSLSLTAHIHMTGDYSKSSFSLTHDSGTGTVVKFV